MPLELVVVVVEYIGVINHGFFVDHNSPVTGDQLLCDRVRVAVEVGSSGKFGHLLQTESIEEGAVPVEETAVGILDKK